MDCSHLREVIEASIGRASSKDAQEWEYWCPFCAKAGSAKRGHLHVNYRKGMCICHTCQTGYRDLLNLVRALYGRVPRNLLAATSRGELVERLDRMLYEYEEKAAKKEPVTLPDGFVPFGSQQPRDSVGRAARRYLASRDVDDRMLEDLGAGYCAQGRMRGYSVFPVYVGGRLVTWTSRATPCLVINGPKAYHAPRSESRVALFGYDVAAHMQARRVFVGEGPFDALAFQRRAREDDAGVGLLGKVLHQEQAALLGELPCKELVMCLDDTEHERTVACAQVLSKVTSKKVSYLLLPLGSGDPHENRLQLPELIKTRVVFDPVLSELRRLVL